MSEQASWPVLRTYDSRHLGRIAMPLGGLGTGTVSLGGRGDLRDWEIMNRPAKGFVPYSGDRIYAPFFSLWARPRGGPAVARILEGPVPPELIEGASGCRAAAPGLPRFRSARFAAAYPLGQVMLEDPAVPLSVRLEAFNPFIPADEAASSLPVAVLRYVLHNPGRRSVAAAVCGTLPNFIGMDGSLTRFSDAGEAIPRGAAGNRNRFRREGDLAGIFMDSKGVPTGAAAWGTLALALVKAPWVSHRTGWSSHSWGGSLLEFWESWLRQGALREPESVKRTDMPLASLAARLNVPARSTRSLTFLIAWHFPNRASWTPVGDPWAETPAAADRVGNHYTRRFQNAWQAVRHTAARLPVLERDTVAFVNAFCSSDLPPPIKEAALFNLSTLRSQTCFRTPDGRWWGWEGVFDRAGSCYGNCTHVWNYEQAAPFLFGNLARSMRETEFLLATGRDGHMAFRVKLPVARAAEPGTAAADGQMGCLVKLYRDWQLSGDDRWLRRLWPQARRALAFAWAPGGWDADQDGVMEGCQHNTLDVEWYGPNPLMGFWYLAALRAAEAMALHVGDAAFAQRCHALWQRGSAWLDAHLFNGDYYRHEIRPPVPGQVVAAGLRMNEDGPPPAQPFAQLGDGCLVDQTAGQALAHLCGLGYLAERGHIRSALRAVMRHNFKPSLADHLCHTRVYALGDEAGLVMASHPRGRPPSPILHFSECMTGFEYTAAVQMIQEGLRPQALRVIRAIRARFDGCRRNPFDEAECGHHYARAMASWGAVPAWPGFHYSAPAGTLTLDDRPGTWFWSTGQAWGTLRLARRGAGRRVECDVLGGRLRLERVLIRGVGPAAFVCRPKSRLVVHGRVCDDNRVRDRTGEITCNGRI